MKDGRQRLTIAFGKQSNWIRDLGEEWESELEKVKEYLNESKGME